MCMRRAIIVIFAVVYAGQLLAVEPGVPVYNDYQSLINRGIFLFEERNYVGCVDVMQEACRVDLPVELRETADWYIALSEARNQSPEAVARLQAFLRDYPASSHAVQARLVLADYYYDRQEYAEALQSIDKALVLAPDFAACYRLRGVCFLRTEKKDAACEAFNKAKELGDPVADKLIKENCQ